MVKKGEELFHFFVELYKKNEIIYYLNNDDKHRKNGRSDHKGLGLSN